MVLADRHPRRIFVVGGLLGMAAAMTLAGLAPTAWALGAAISLFWVAGGCGVSLSRATLMDADPERREQVLARWSFVGTLGDLATPAFLWALALAGLGWRAGFLISGAILFAFALVVAPHRFPGPRGVAAEEDEGVPLRETLRAALANRRLMGWLFGVSLCGMLDELLVAFGSLYMERDLGLDLAARSAALTALMAGAAVGVVAAERLLARGVDPLRLLLAACAGSVAALAAWLAATGPIGCGVAMALVGVSGAPLWPIAQAQAYRALPNRSALVHAMAGLFAPVELALPLTLGLAADHLGLRWALALVAIQPLGLALVALASPRDSAR